MTKTLALKAFVKRFGLASMRRREVPSVHSNSKSGWMGRLPPSVSAAFRFCGRERRQRLFCQGPHCAGGRRLWCRPRTLKAPTSLLISAPSSTAAGSVKCFTVNAVSPARLIFNCDFVSGAVVEEHRKCGRTCRVAIGDFLVTALNLLLIPATRRSDETERLQQ